jgi:hypothetical protein
MAFGGRFAGRHASSVERDLSPRRLRLLRGVWAGTVSARCKTLSRDAGRGQDGPTSGWRITTSVPRRPHSRLTIHELAQESNL